MRLIEGVVLNEVLYSSVTPRFPLRSRRSLSRLLVSMEESPRPAVYTSILLLLPAASLAMRSVLSLTSSFSTRTSKKVMILF